MTKLQGFSKQEAESLLATRVIKRVLQKENPAVKPGQKGKVIQAEKSKIANGYAVTVDWGIERWQYDTPEDFHDDVQVTGGS